MRANKYGWCLAVALWAAVSGCAAKSATGGAQVQVSTIDYKGWAGAVELTNGEVRLVVVPSIGRIMHYGFVGEANVLWDDPQHYGKTLPGGQPFKDEEGNLAWTNFGGDKVWPNQQSEFEAINGYAWPPDPAYDGGAHQVEMLADGVTITGPLSPLNGARSIRTIRLAASGSRVSIEQRLQKEQAVGNSELDPLRYTIWNVTQIRPPEQTLYPLNPLSDLKGGIHHFEWQAEVSAKNYRAEDGIGIYIPDPEENQKIGADSDGWLAGIVDQTVIAEFYRRDDAAIYPDGGLSAEVYTCPDYTELELLSPWVPLAVGEVLDFPIAWELHRLPEEAQTADARRRAALEWLRSHP